MMEWVRGEVVGRGSFGTVNLAIPRNQSARIPQLMAVKSCGSSHSAFLMNEKAILEELGECPEIIRCFGGDFSFESGEKSYYLLLEYASEGNLADKIKNSGDRRLPESEARRYTGSVLKGLQYIHENGFVHCDIKLQNILLCSSKYGGNDVAKIADFGLAKRAGVKTEKFGVELRGTPLYMAPETVVAGEQEAAADVWALGCLVVEMVTGAPAWTEDDVCRLLMRIGVGDETPQIPGNLSPAGKDFLKKCFLKDPTKRWTVEMLLNHPFIVDDQGDDDRVTVPSVETCGADASTSPQGPFDFPDWEMVQSPCCSITPSPSPEYSCKSNTSSWLSSTTSPAAPEERIRWLVADQRPQDWSVSNSWVTVR